MRRRSSLLGPAKNVQCLWRTPNAARDFRCGVSLHGHTHHSRERLDFIPRVMRQNAIIHALFRFVEYRHLRRSGKSIEYGRAFWRPPLNATAAYRLEAGQIQQKLGLEALVSLTDHDVLDACAELRAVGIPAPYSMEWSVPYRSTVFHLGVHNLPEAAAGGFREAMQRYINGPDDRLLAAILAELDESRDILVVLNHPFVTEGRLDRPSHAKLLREFLAAHAGRIHAFELNGLQPAADNRDVLRLASEYGLPAISGGDRHCLEPNANVNLTNAASFAEFVDEIRRERLSHVLFLPQYQEPLAARYIGFIWEAVKPYPELVGRERWINRIYYERRGEPGVVLPLARTWTSGGPAAVRSFISAVGFLAAPQMRGALRLAFGHQEEVVS